ncbi:hypothetical protein M670_01539 [Schinkia azotoformans MEV2011]|nr:hypothetical protein [Schinkia azotoformans]KEF39149.1 hypothetical protein M670_01539 [Schinkia azotoformans MEV2011]MEC1638473.1 hypothetical protein [Schinkia azotoformans]MEC1698116.1 hypothetical protein [Schinkia azotoformans]MEC1717625.1 hypothetical protein [Schinkia azotoformans]MEC1721330.1 hypothetical protein [Schinkia azotoformans]
MAKRISELYEHELIEMAAKNLQKEQIKREWFSRWGLEFPMIRTAFGVKKYGEDYTAKTEMKNKEYVAI